MDKLYPTKEEVLQDYKAFKEKIKDFPLINTTHCDEIKDFVKTYARSRNANEANEVLTYLLPLEDEWREYYLIHPSNLYVNIYLCIAYAYTVKKQLQKAILRLEECLRIVSIADEYKWLFQIKADLCYNLSILYFNIDNDLKSREYMRKGIYQSLSMFSNIAYDNYAFYTFHSMDKHVLEGIRDNKISLANPNRFNDPIDPVIISLYDLRINAETRIKEKNFLKMQQDIYKEIRITSLSRAIPLPEENSIPHEIKDPPFAEINKATMWGYYAKSHTGICIKYVFPMSLMDYAGRKPGELLMLRNVKYKSKYNPRHSFYRYNDAFFTKGKVWKHEGECRLVYFKEGGNVPDFQWIELPEGCIKEIYIGYAASDKDKRRLKRALKNHPEIKVYQMQLSEKNIFAFEPIEIKVKDLK